jgi:hypothetical protein
MIYIIVNITCIVVRIICSIAKFTFISYTCYINAVLAPPADFLLTTVCCIVPSRRRMMQCHYKTTLTLYSSGEKTG